MKKRIFLSLIAIVLLGFTAFSFVSCGDEFSTEEILYVYNWGEYISDGSDGTVDVNAEFEAYCREVLGKNVKVN